MLRLMPMRTVALMLLIGVVSGCASDSPTASDGTVEATKQRAMQCEGGSQQAVADYFPNSPQNQFAESVGEPTAELAALQLLNFGQDFDADAYEVSTSEAGRVTYSDAQGAVVADVAVVTTRTNGFVATEMKVCKSALTAP